MCVCVCVCERERICDTVRVYASVCVRPSFCVYLVFNWAIKIPLI